MVSKHMVIVIFHFRVKMWFLNKNRFVSQNYWSFTETRVIGTENNLRMFELDPIIFLDFHVFEVWNTKK